MDRQSASWEQRKMFENKCQMILGYDLWPNINLKERTNLKIIRTDALPKLLQSNLK